MRNLLYFQRLVNVKLLREGMRQAWQWRNDSVLILSMVGGFFFTDCCQLEWWLFAAYIGETGPQWPVVHSGFSPVSSNTCKWCQPWRHYYFIDINFRPCVVSVFGARLLFIKFLFWLVHLSVTEVGFIKVSMIQFQTYCNKHQPWRRWQCILN